MGNSLSQAPAEGDQEEEKKKSEATASSSSSGFSMLKAGAMVAGTGLLALGTLQLLSQLSSKDAADTDEEGPQRMLAGESLTSRNGGSSYCLDLEGSRWPSSSGQGKLYTFPYLRSDPKVLKILTYNVWSGDVELQERMKAIGDLIQEHSPDLICFQEITPIIYEIFENSHWWEAYICSVSPQRPLRNYFCMQMSKLPAKFYQKPIGLPNKERELCIAEVEIGAERRLAFATSHLVSPNPHASQMYSEERVSQAKRALTLLKNYSNVIFGGDLNWDEEVDGPILLPRGWVGEDGWTFDTKANRMLSFNPPLQKRLDRFLCYLSSFSISNIEIIGTEVVPELYYCKEWKTWKIVHETILPVLPSDHFGLLLTIVKGKRLVHCLV